MQGLMEHPLVMSAPRKQNIACDACRTRKVKCVMIQSQDKCQHCHTKSYPCTFNVQRETSEKKRQGTAARRRNSETTVGALQNTPFRASSGSSSPVSIPQAPNYTETHSAAPSITNFYPEVYHSLTSRQHPLVQTIDSASPNQAQGTHFIPLPPQPPQPSHLETPTTRLIGYLLSPDDRSPLYPESTKGYRALPDFQQRHKLSLDDWGEVGVKLQDPAFRIEFALDLVEVYFEICHARLPLLGPAYFRAQLRTSLPPTSALSISGRSPSISHPSLHHSPQINSHHTPPSPSSSKHIHPAILATVLAWGAKFSEHPLILQDRDADPSGARRSRLAMTLIKKAREVAEAEKVHVIPSPDAVICCILLDGLHSHLPLEPDGYRAFWLNCSLRHLIHMQVNNRSAPSTFVEPDRIDTMHYAWWIACLADGFSSAYFRLKPVLEDADYNIEFYQHDIMRISQAEIIGPEAENQFVVVARPEFRAWFDASHSMARCAREMSRQLWRPIIQSDGIPIDVLCSIMRLLNRWRGEHLDKVGVPGVQVNWDFVAAVAACAHDSNFHVMWVILFQALRDFGILEVNAAKRAGNNITSHPFAAQIAATEATVREEALNGASRIAGLANLLTQSSYLRLDPNVMRFSIYAAGKLLAEFGRDEVTMCIRGLQQYSVAYEDALDQAAEIQRLYASSSCVDTESAHVWVSDGRAENQAVPKF